MTVIAQVLPGGEEVEDADARYGRAGERADHLEEHGEHAAAVHIHGLVVLARYALYVSLYHESGEGYHPRDVKRHKAEEFVRQLEEGGQLVLRQYQRGAGDDHGADDEAEKQPAAREAEAGEAEGQRRGDKGRYHDGEERDGHAVEEIQVKLFLRENVLVILGRELLQRGQETRRELIERAVGLERGADHVDHRQYADGAADEQQQVLHGQRGAALCELVSSCHDKRLLRPRRGSSWP